MLFSHDVIYQFEQYDLSGGPIIQGVAEVSDIKERDEEETIIVLRRIDSATQRIEGIVNLTEGQILQSEKYVRDSIAEHNKHADELAQSIQNTQMVSADRVADSMGRIADAINNYNTTLQEQKEDAKEQWGIIAGKKQMPYSMVILLVTLMSICFIIALSAVANRDIVIDTSSVRVSRGAERNLHINDVEKPNKGTSTNENNNQ